MIKSYFRVDLSLLIPAMVLVVFGLAGIFSLSPILFRSQIAFLIVSLIAFFIFSQVDYKRLKDYKLWIYISAVVLLSFLLVVGAENRGSVRWLEFYGFRVQFSEIFKPFLAISLAGYLADRQTYSFKSFLISFLLIAPIFILIFLQPDLGNALIYFITFFLVLFTFGFPLRFFLSIFAFFLITSPILWTFLRDYQRNRIMTFLKLEQDPLGLSYNAIQSVIAVGSGMFFGKGFGQGTQSILRFLPERHTDFIFATLSEEVGIIGSMVIIMTFAFLLFRIYSIYRIVSDDFMKVFAICCFFLIAVQFFVNAGMNVGIVPIVGVSLPFVSYGGSSLLSNFIMLGLLSALSGKKESRVALEIR
jgi:rod shape determining protein RodA